MTDAEHETLDPQDWGEMRDLAHHMVDDAFSYLETVRERPALAHLEADFLTPQVKTAGQLPVVGLRLATEGAAGFGQS